ncbi:hypothetical protein BS47DRAFT_376919 [Hydnum rufescens UP504]|uniref:Protein kinase domain-containing protein n=1 Tax=Hydnum rufescens UP504 TaxID=1448309 RepID=A0A9P6DX46_9AGAM|nr:hypothetical protein BS47DRAFT_376919 [Hydnum rufescens UP504]
MKLLQDLSDESDSLPPSLYVNNVTIRDAVNEGGEAQIRSGSYDGLDVAIRQFQQRGNMTKPDWRKIIRREIIIHRYIRHDNVLPLIGVFGDEAHPFNVVTPWMHHGVASEYLKTRPDRFFDIARGSSAGLAYLHGCVPPVIHGDIHSVRSARFRKHEMMLTVIRYMQENILVDSGGNAQLCDFGLSRIKHEAKRTRTKTHEGGYPRNLAPEITSGDDERVNITPQTDIYALAMTIYELGTRTRPLDQYTRFQVQRAVEEGKRPAGPDTMKNLSDTERRDIRTVWPLLERMWAQEPASRPSAVDTFEELRGRNNFGVKMPLTHIHPMYAAYNENP